MAILKMNHEGTKITKKKSREELIKLRVLRAFVVNIFHLICPAGQGEYGYGGNPKNDGAPAQTQDVVNSLSIKDFIFRIQLDGAETRVD